MRVGLVGRGRAAGTLRPRLEAVGHAVAWHWSHRDADRPEALPQVEVVLLAVPDGAIEPAARSLAPREGASGEVWLHLSGSRPGEVARATEGVPRAAGCLHPLQSLPGESAPATHLHGATAGLDGEPEAVRVAEALARELGMVPRRLAPGGKPLYHAAAVTAAGHVAALFAEALEMLEAAGFDRTGARDALLPLTRGTVDNLGRGLPEEMITGPIARGDVETVAGHLEALDGAAPELAASYRLLARRALALSADGLDPAVVARLRELLGREP